MDEATDFLSILAIAVSVGVAVGVAKWNRSQQRREWRFSVFRRLSGYRYRLTNSLKHKSFDDGEPFVALNEARLVFGDCKGVQMALDKFHRNRTKRRGDLADDLTKVIREIGNVIDKKVMKELTEEHIGQVLVPPQEKGGESGGDSLETISKPKIPPMTIPQERTC